MQRRARSPSGSLQANPVDSISSSGVQSNPSRPPWGLCPYCSIPIMKRQSKTQLNPDRWFYKCPNYQKDPICRFYMWEEEFEAYVHGARGVTVQDLVSRIENRLDDLSEELKKNCQCNQLKKRIKMLDSSVDKLNRKFSNIELICACFLIVLVGVLVVIVGK